MAGDWIPMTSRILKDPKLIRISRMLRDKKPFVEWFMPGGSERNRIDSVSEKALRSVTHSLLTVIWVWAREFGKEVEGDCFIGLASFEDVDEIVGFSGFALIMESVGWLRKSFDQDGVVFPNFFKNMNFPKTNAEKQKEYRERKKQEIVTGSVTQSLPQKSNKRVTKEKESKVNILIKEKEKNKAKKDKEKLDAETPNPDETPANGLVVEKTERKERIPTVLVEQIFEDWKHFTDNPGARLGKKRPEIIRGAVRMGYDRDQLRQAFIGCARSSFHAGFNEAGKKYTDLELILRNEKNIDRFIGYASNPPKPTFKTEDNTPLLVRRQAQEFWESACADARDQEAPGRGNVIDADAWETIQPKLAH